MALQRLNLTIRKGSAEDIPIRVESDVWSYATISAVSQSAPLRVTAEGHGIPDGWRAAIMNVKGPTSLNAEIAEDLGQLKDADLRKVTTIDADTVEFNAINGAGLKPYVSGGQLIYRAPLGLNLYIGARMNVRNKVGGNLLANWTTDTGELAIDVANTALWLRLDDSTTEALTPGTKVFDIELIRTGGKPDRICAHDSTLVVLDETTTE